MTDPLDTKSPNPPGDKPRRRFKGDPGALPKPHAVSTLDPTPTNGPSARPPAPSPDTDIDSDIDTRTAKKKRRARAKTRTRPATARAKTARQKPKAKRSRNHSRHRSRTLRAQNITRQKPLRIAPVLALPAAYFLPLWHQARQVGSAMGTVWRGAERIDSALWQVLRVGFVKLDGTVRWLTGLILGSLAGLARWLPTRAGRGYCAFFGVVLLVSGLWIADEIRASDLRALGTGTTMVSRVSISDRGNPILARLDGDYIRLADVERAARLAGSIEKEATLKTGTEQTRMLLNDLIDQRLLARAATDAGLHREPALEGQLDLARERLLAAAFLDQQIAKTVTPQRVERLYTAQADVTSLGEEIRARHILVETRAEAIAIITKIDRGADFSTLARSLSLDRGTAPHGGDMGTITRDMVSDEFARIAFTVDEGALSLPFKTEEGWNIVEVLEKRETEPIAFAGVRGDLERFLELRTIDRTLTQLRETYDVTLVPQGQRQTRTENSDSQ